MPPSSPKKSRPGSSNSKTMSTSSLEGTTPDIAFGRRSFPEAKQRDRLNDDFAWLKGQKEEAGPDVPYYMQGDPDLHNSKNMMRRRQLRRDPRVKRALGQFWDMFAKDRDMCVSKEAYINFLVRICKLVIPEFSEDDARATAITDWERDAQGASALNYNAFFNAFFELADLWCPTIDGREYALFLDQLRARLTQMVITKPDGRVIRKKAVMRHVKAREVHPALLAGAGLKAPPTTPLAASGGGGGGGSGAGAGDGKEGTGEEVAATKVQALARRRQASKTVAKKRADREREEAARKIQKITRGRQARKRVKKIKTTGKDPGPPPPFLFASPSESKMSASRGSSRGSLRPGSKGSSRPSSRRDMRRAVGRAHVFPNPVSSAGVDKNGFVDVMYFEGSDQVEDGDVVTVGWCDLDAIEHAPELALDSDDEESDDETEGGAPFRESKPESKGAELSMATPESVHAALAEAQPKSGGFGSNTAPSKEDPPAKASSPPAASPPAGYRRGRRASMDGRDAAAQAAAAAAATAAAAAAAAGPAHADAHAEAESLGEPKPALDLEAPPRVTFGGDAASASPAGAAGSPAQGESKASESKSGESKVGFADDDGERHVRFAPAPSRDLLSRRNLGPMTVDAMSPGGADSDGTPSATPGHRRKRSLRNSVSSIRALVSPAPRAYRRGRRATPYPSEMEAMAPDTPTLTSESSIAEDFDAPTRTPFNSVATNVDGVGVDGTFDFAAEEATSGDQGGVPMLPIAAATNPDMGTSRSAASYDSKGDEEPPVDPRAEFLSVDILKPTPRTAAVDDAVRSASSPTKKRTKDPYSFKEVVDVPALESVSRDAVGELDDAPALVAPSRRPPRIWVVGKPGIGKTSTGSRLATQLGLIHVSPVELLARLVAKAGAGAGAGGGDDDEDGEEGKADAGADLSDAERELVEALRRGEAVTEAQAVRVAAAELKRAVESELGYVLDGLSTKASFGMLRAALGELGVAASEIDTYLPDKIVHLDMPDADVVLRRAGSRLDPISGQVLDPQLLESMRPPLGAGEEEEEGDEGDLAQAGVIKLPKRRPALLVERPEDRPDAVKASLESYIDNGIAMDPSHIDVDAGQSQDAVVEEALMRLGEALPPFVRMPVPVVTPRTIPLPEDVADSGDAMAQRISLLTAPLPDPDGAEEEEEEEEEGEEELSAEDAAHAARAAVEKARSKLRYWSAFRGMCPVTFKQEGVVAAGSLAHACEFAGKVYLMADADKAALFNANPRPFVQMTPKLPAHTRVAIVGPTRAGCSTVATALATRYSMPLIDAPGVVARRADPASKGMFSRKVVKALGTGDALEADILGQVLGTEAVFVQKGGDHIANPPDSNPAPEVKDADDAEPAPGSQGWVMDGAPSSVAAWETMIKLGAKPSSVVLLDPTADGGGEGDDEEDLSWGTVGRKRASAVDVDGKPTVAPHLPSSTEFSASMDPLRDFLRSKGIEVRTVPAGGNYTAEDVAALSVQAVDPFAIRVDPAAEVEAVPEEARRVGDTGKYCPVTLVDEGVLVPGKEELSARAMDSTFIFADEDAQRRFVRNPERYLHRAGSGRSAALPPVQPLGHEDAEEVGASNDTADALRPAPPPRFMFLAPNRSGSEALLERLSKEFGVHVSFPLEELKKHPVWGPKLEKKPKGDEDEDEDEEEEEDSGPPPEAIAEAIRDAYRHPSAGRGVAVVIPTMNAELAEALTAAKVPPSVVLPVRFNEDRLVSSRMEDEFKWAPPEPKVPDEDEDEEPEEPEEPPTAEELAEMEEAAREEAKEAIAGSVSEDTERLGGVAEAFNGAGVQVLAPINYDGNKDRVYTRVATALKPYLFQFETPFSTATKIKPKAAVRDMKAGRRRLGKFGPYCPVAMKETGEYLTSSAFPVAHGPHLFMCSSEEAARKFARNPARYTVPQAAAAPWIPPTCAVVGAPTCGKSKLAASIAADRDLLYVSPETAIEEGLKRTSTALGQALSKRLASGQDVSGDLVVEAIKMVLRSKDARTRGWVLDGFPETREEAEALDAAAIVPTLVFNMQIGADLALRRAGDALEREHERLGLSLGMLANGQKKPGEEDEEEDEDAPPKPVEGLEEGVGITPQPTLPSDWFSRARAGGPRGGRLIQGRSRLSGGPVSMDPTLELRIVGTRYNQYSSNATERDMFYLDRYDNERCLDVTKSKWAVSREACRMLKTAVERQRKHAQAVSLRRPTPIADVPIRSTDMKQRTGFMGTYCPVRWATRRQLVSQRGAATLRSCGVEFKRKFYFPAGPAERAAFIAQPTRYLVNQHLPKHLPSRVYPHDHKLYTRKPDFKGFCPVTMRENPTYEGLVRGDPTMKVLYKGEVYTLESEAKLNRFMQMPERYANQKLPAKLPPRTSKKTAHDLSKQELPSMVGYVEQSVGDLVIRALTAIGEHRDTLKHPILSVRGTALAFVSLYLTAHNPHSKGHVRTRQQQRLRDFLDECGLGALIKSNVPSGSGVRAVRASPRVLELGGKFDMLLKENTQTMHKRLFR